MQSHDVISLVVSVQAALSCAAQALRGKQEPVYSIQVIAISSAIGASRRACQCIIAIDRA